MSEAEEQRWVTVMLDKLAAQESKRRLGDAELTERAARLSDLIADRGQTIVTTADPGTLGAARRRAAAVWRIGEGNLVRET
jgi:hypothetical protein